MHRSLILRTACTLAVSISPVAAQQPTVPVAGGAVYDTSVFGALKWREIGPFRGGRSVAVAGSSSRPLEYYFGTTGGGVFKSTDGGITWVAISDKYFGGSIGSIGIAESNPDIVYVGTGEYPIRGNVTHGDGVFKTTDAGRTWKFVGLGDSRHISRVRVHPRDPNLVYVGVQGHTYGPNTERGVYKTTDGGTTWTRILYRNDSTGITDLALDPSNPDVIYAALWDAHRKPWQMVSGGPGSGILKSTDAGASWTEITRNPGLPSGIIGNIGISVSGANPQRVYAIIEADSGGVFLSDDAGATWKRTNSDRRLRQRAWYYTRIFADPKTANTVYVLNTSAYRSTDGGKTFTRVRTPHGDTHDLWIAPNDPNRMAEGDDGGATVTFNAGRSWSEEDQATAQFYHVTTTNHFPYKVCGAQQDNSTLCGPSRADGGISRDDWQEAGGGESGYIAVRPDMPDVVFAGSYGAYLTRKDMRTGLSRNVNPWPDNPMGHSAGDLRYRFQWTFPIVISPHDPNTIYAAGNVLFKSTNEGQNWTAISGDLTRHDPRTLGPSGGPITKDQTSVEYYATIFAVAESPRERGVIWTGSDDGLIHISRDAGKTWMNVTPRDFGDWTRVSSIEPSRHRAGTAYVAANRYQLDDFRPYIWKTTDYGRSWTSIVTGIPATEFTRVVREDPERPGLLYAGTERSVWVSFDDGARWQPLRRNLPLVPIHDLAMKDGDMVAATHGRSFWILDDLSALRQLAPAIVTKRAHLFTPRAASRASFGGGGGTGAAGSHPTGQNPPAGAVIYYWLKNPRELVTLDVLDSAGRVIRSFTSQQDSAAAADSVRADSVRRVNPDSAAVPAPDTTRRPEAEGEGPEEETPGRRPRTPRLTNTAGLNRFAWNLRYPDAVWLENLIMWAGSVQGPVAPPGRYAVRLNVGGESQTQSFTLRRDPRSSATQADLGEQFRLLLSIRDTLSAANNAVRTVRNVRAQITDSRVKLAAARRAAFDATANPVLSALTAAEEEIYQVRNRSNQDPLNYPIKLNNKIAALAGVVASTAARPTAQSYTVFNELARRLAVQLRAVQSALGGLARVNAELRAAGVAEIVPSTAEIAAPHAAASSGGGAVKGSY